MPYRCVHCSKIYLDGSSEVLNGCTCKSKFFFYLSEKKLKEIENHVEPDVVLSDPEKDKMEKEVREIAGIENENESVFLDFESVKVIKPGQYLIDLQKLFQRGKPRIYKLEEGKYVIDLRIPDLKS
ncbi:MAG: Zn-ribbon containing protein [Nanoarchaeota archaeon]